MNLAALRTGPAVMKWRQTTFYHTGPLELATDLTNMKVAVENFGVVEPRPDKTQLMINFTPSGRVQELQNVINRYAASNVGELINIEQYGVAINVSTHVLTTSTAHLLADGDEIMFHSLITLPAPLVANTRYYARVTGNSTTSLTVYDTQAHALATGATTGMVNAIAGTGIVMDVTRSLSIWWSTGLKMVYYNVGLVKVPQLRLSAGQTLLGQLGFQAFVRNGQDPDDPTNRYHLETIEANPDTSFTPADIHTDSPTLTWNIGTPWNTGLTTAKGATVDINVETNPLPVDAFGDDACGKILKDRNLTVTAAVQGPSEKDVLDATRIQSATRGQAIDPDTDYSLVLETANHVFTVAEAILTTAPMKGSSTEQRIGDLKWESGKTFTAGVLNPVWSLTDPA